MGAAIMDLIEQTELRIRELIEIISKKSLFNLDCKLDKDTLKLNLKLLRRIDPNNKLLEQIEKSGAI